MDKNLELRLFSNMENLNEIIVTAQKREELIQDIPVSITSLSKEAILDNQIQYTNDLTAITPNLYASDPGDSRTVTSIRGIVSTSYDPAVATYIDGVNQFNLDTYVSQLFDIERIEILRGPQGTLYGRNAMGGVINIVTKKPEKETAVFAEAGFGNYGRHRYLASVQTPLWNDKLSFGAAALYTERNGFYRNEFNNSDYDSQKSLSGNYYLKYHFNPSWNATLNFKHFYANNEGAFPLVIGKEAAFESPFTLNQNQLAVMKDHTINSSLVIEHKGSDLNFSSQTAFQKNYRYYQNGIDADFSALDALYIKNDYGKDWNNVKVVTQEFRFSSPARNKKLNWTGGSYIFYEESPVKQATVFGEDAAMLGSEATNFSLISTSESTSKGIAFFGQADYELTSKLNFIAGLRYDYEHKEQSVVGEYQQNDSPEPAFKFQPDTSAVATFKAFSPKLGTSYELSEEYLFFLTYSKGYRAGGLTPLTTDPNQPPLYEYRPEFSNNFEIGAKNTFLNKKILLNATLFYTTVTDVQVPTLLLPDAVVITRNTGKMTSKGLEVELRTKPFKGLELNYDLGITNAKYDDLKVAGEDGMVDLGGNMQVFTPDLTSMLSIHYTSDFDFINGLDFSFYTGWKHIGKQYFDLANTLKQEPYSLFNAHFGMKYHRYKLVFWANNIFDKKYISYGYNFGAVHLGNPASFGTSLYFQL